MVKKIGPEHAQALGRLEAEIYPPAFCLGWQDFNEDLEQAEYKNKNFSFGSFEGNEIVGYLIAYIQNQEIFVSDLAILPQFRVGRNLVMLLTAFLQAASQTKLPIVAECRENSHNLSLCENFFGKFGYTLVHNASGEWRCGEQMYDIKFSYTRP